MTTFSPNAHFRMQRLAMAAALAGGALLTACGGGGGDGTPVTTPTTQVSQSDATADAANASTTGEGTASAVDSVIDTTASLALAVAQPTASSERERAQAAPVSSPVTGVTVDCGGGGTATLTITGGTLASEINGRLDAGEHYSVIYAQCTGRAGWAQLNGSVEMDVTAADSSTSPQTLALSLTVTRLALSLPSGTATLDGTASVSRSVSTSGTTTTTISQVTVPSATLATAFNARSGSFTLSNLVATRTVTAVAGVTTASQYSGHHTLAGTADGRTFSYDVSTSGNVDYDSLGALSSGAWTLVRPDATIATTVANGVVVITVDDGNDGTIDHTWTFAKAQLDAAAG